MRMPIYRGDVPYLTTGQMIEVDRAMMEDFRIDLVRMMENAGRNLAHLARVRFLDSDPRGRRVTVLAGTGGNGGGALVCARRLHNYGALVSVLVTGAEGDLAPVTDQQMDILHRMRVPVARASMAAGADSLDLIIDGVIGYSLRGAPQAAAGDLIRWANEQGAPVLSLDVPSGVDMATGAVHDPAIRATATLTLALPKEGLQAAGVGDQVGEPYLADISVPPSLYAGPGLALQVGNLFAEGDIIRLS
jgi:NAD(P)H-hydrate epimerase